MTDNMPAEIPIPQSAVIDSKIPQEPSIYTNGNHTELPVIDLHAETEHLMKDGFVPAQFDPEIYGEAVQAFTSGRGEEVDENFINTHVKPNERLSYNGKLSSAVEQLDALINRTGVYNALTPKEGEPYNIYLQDPKATEIHEKVLETLRDKPFIVVAPFAVEPESIGGVVNHVAGRVGRQNVLAVDAGIDPVSGRLARETGTETINQWDYLNAIDMSKLISDSENKNRILPEGTPPLKGTKGLTMYAGLLKLAAQGKLTKDHYIAFHDTDVDNAGPTEGRGKGKPVDKDDISDYTALDYLAVPFAYPVKPDSEIFAVHIGRTGEGRNNESWLRENQHHFNAKDSSERELATHLSSLMWPLTGERVIRGDILAQIPWPIDMNIETMLNFAIGGMEVRQTKRGIMQVANPSQKKENRSVPNEREWGMLTACEVGLRSYFTFLSQSDRFPHEWDEADIHLYNLDYTNRSWITSTKNSYNDQPNKLVKVNTGLLLPSVNMLMASGAFDINKVPNNTLNQ